jgi:hypothetical protein
MATTTTRSASKTLDSFVDPFLIRRTSPPAAVDPTLREPPLGRDSCLQSISLCALHISLSRDNRRLT